MLQKTAIEPRTLELLKRLQSDSKFEKFHLAGGTGLALQINHRMSADMDLFAMESFDAGVYMDYLRREYCYLSDYFAQNTLKGSINSIKVDFIAHLYKNVSPIVHVENLRFYSTADIAAMKVNAIAGSGTRSKDFVNLYFLLKQFSIEQILGFYQEK